jgi:hypothetical protein
MRQLSHNLVFGRSEDAIKASEHSEGQDYFSIFIAFIGTPEEIAYTPDK